MVLEDIIVGREPEDVRKYGKAGCVYLGKHIVGTGFESHMTNPILMDVTRPHVVLIVGKRGCLTGDTKVFTNNGYKNIENFDEKNDKILSFNIRNLGLEWKDASLLTYDVDANEELLKFKLNDGREIITTTEHPLLVLHKDVVLQWKKAKDIAENERLITITQLPEIKNDKESLRMARLLGFILADGNMSVRKGRFKDGRGYWYNGTKRRIRIFNAVDEVLKTAKDDFEKEFGITAKRYKRNDCNCEIVETKHGKVLDRFVELGVPTGKKHNIIKIPDIVWESSNEFKANFIKALFACDGTISKNGDHIEYYTTSEEFIKGLQLLLAHFSIESNIKPKMTGCNGKMFLSYRLHTSDYTSLINFRERIGFFDKNKLERSMKRKFWRVKRRKGTKYIENNMVCCRIIKKDRINGIKNVYDLSVPDNHSFIANGIISHNSGKSYTSAVVAEEIMELPEDIKKNLTCLMIDTMGIFWSMKSQNEKDFNILTEWGLKPRGYPIQHIVPIGLKDFYDKAGIDYDATFAIKPSELSAGDWALTFGISLYDTLGILLERTIKNLKGKNYKINDIIDMIEIDKRSEEKDKMALENRFMAAENWGIFSDEATPIELFLKPGIATVLDVSLQEWSVRNLMLGILSREIYQARVAARREEELALISGEEAKKIPMTWVIIDECLPYNSEIITDKAHTPIGDIVTRFKDGEKIKVLGYDSNNNKYDYYDVTNVFEKGMREIIEITTETGRKLRCTANHNVLTKKGYLPALRAEDIGTPLPQYYGQKENEIKARILGHLFGDGWLQSNYPIVGFSGNIEDLKQIKNDLSLLGFSSGKIQERKTESKITDCNNHTVHVHDISNQFIASTKCYNIFQKLGAPKGEKPMIIFKIPEWLLKSSEKEKIEFLASLMGSDGSTPRARKKDPRNFEVVRLSFNKNVEMETDVFVYASQLVQMFKDVGIKANISKRNGNIRKDGKRTIKIVITLSNSMDNLITFFEKIGYRYCKKKEVISNQILAYLKYKKKIIEERTQLRENAIELHKKGLGKIKVARELHIPVYQAREWIYYSRGKIRVPNNIPIFKEWIQQRLVNNVLYEKIVNNMPAGKEEVYDISVSSVHNFVANGCITHNCHQFLPAGEETAASHDLNTLVTQGRQPGISLIFITQRPNKLHETAIAQSDLIIAHRLTSKPDLDALSQVMQTYLLEDIKKSISNLPKNVGAALILDDNSERLFNVQIRPRMSWHAGGSPIALKEKI